MFGSVSAQVGIGTNNPDVSAMLDVSSSSKGVLLPRLTTQQRNDIASPQEGLLVYDSEEAAFYYYTDGEWKSLAECEPEGSGAANQVAYWTGSDDLSGSNSLVWNGGKLGIGTSAPLSPLTVSNTTGVLSFAVEAPSGMTATDNTIAGRAAGFNLSSGTKNTAFGYEALFTTSTTAYNTAFGYQALRANTSNDNTAVGTSALAQNNTGWDNTAVGHQALSSNQGGYSNTAIGMGALYLNNSIGNTATGCRALYMNQGGMGNTGMGVNALTANASGNDNTAVGAESLKANTTGHRNTAVGKEAFTTGTGYSNSTAIGYYAQITDNNMVRLGNDNITSLICMGAYAATTTSSPNLYVDNTGKFFRSTASYINLKAAFTPSGSADPAGTTGDVTWDDNYLYVKTSAGWKRTALSGF